MPDIALTAVNRSTPGDGLGDTAYVAFGKINTNEAAIKAAVDPMREALTAARTYYVRTDGNNANTGLVNTSGGAWLTLQKAMDVIASDLDLGPYNVTISVADGTYTGNLEIKPYRATSGYVLFQGNTTTPANCVISTTSVSSIISNSIVGRFYVQGFKLQTTTSGSGVEVRGFGLFLELTDIEFGTCVTNHLFATTGASVQVIGPIAVSGNAGVGFWANRKALVFMSSQTITYSNSPVYSARNFAATEQGWIDCYSMTFTNGGTVTGTRYIADGLGGIFTNGGGATYVPGDGAGSVANGGVYY